MNCSNSLKADVPGQYNIQLLCLITFPGTIKLPPSIAHVSEGKISFTFTTLTHLSCCLDCAFTAKENIYSTLKQNKTKKEKNPTVLTFHIKPKYSFESVLTTVTTTNFRTTRPIHRHIVQKNITKSS